MVAAAQEPDLGVLTGQLMRALQEELFETLGEQGRRSLVSMPALCISRRSSTGAGHGDSSAWRRPRSSA